MKEDKLENKILDLAIKYKHTYIDTVYIHYQFEKHLINTRYKDDIENTALQKTERYLKIYYSANNS
jgi:hypothetical protein